MTEQVNPEEAHKKLWQLVETFQAAMLVTRAQTGALDARPMSPIIKDDEGLIYILTETQSETVRSLRSDPVALLSFCDGKQYVSMSGHADVTEDRALIERLWNPGAQAFWPEGPAKPRLSAVIFRPESGQYWKSDNAVSTAIQLAAAAVTGRPPNPGEHGAVKL